MSEVSAYFSDVSAKKFDSCQNEEYCLLTQISLFVFTAHPWMVEDARYLRNEIISTWSVNLGWQGTVAMLCNINVECS